MQFEFFSKYFPLPKFLNPTHIGISFSDKNIKAVYFEKSGTGFDLKSKVVELESGTIVDGKIVNQKILVSKLGEIRDYFKTAFVFFTLPDELAYLFEIY
jgi:Tfp pilus assembly PilM family ATPase